MPGVSVVVDSGLVKVARYDAARGVDRLDLERVTADSATQRAGRAARLGPGLVRRLWDARDRLRESREPDIARVDLAGRRARRRWRGAPIRAPSSGSSRRRRTPSRRPSRCSSRLGAVPTRSAGACRSTPLGRQLQRWPVHVRLARMLLDGRGAPNVAAACALLTEGSARGPGGATTSCDLLADLDRFARAAAVRCARWPRS